MSLHTHNYKSSWSSTWKRIAHDPLVWVTLLLFIIYLMVVAVRPQGIFWSLDEGGKFIYLENVLKFSNPAAPLYYPGRAIDPQAHFIPLYWQARVSDTEIYSWWPVGFPLVTIPFYLVFGWIGLYVLPAAGGASAALFSGLVVRKLAPNHKRLDFVAAILVGIATPVFYYSTMFWEHTLSTAFFMGSLCCLIVASQQQSPKFGLWLLAGGLASISAFFRTDALPLIAGIGLALLIMRFQWAVPFGSGFILTSLPWLVANKLIMGDFFSRQLPSMNSQGWFFGFRTAGLKFIPYTLFNAPLIQALPIGKYFLITGTLCFIVALIAPFFNRLRAIALFSYAGLLAISTWALLNPTIYRSVHGFILIAPQIIFFAWLWANEKIKKFSFIGFIFLLSIFTYSAAYLSKMWVAGGGQQWGPRYMLALYPLFVIASIIGIANNWISFRKYFKVGITLFAVALTMTGIGFEIRGEIWAQKTAVYYDASRKAILALPEKPITTNCTFLPMLMPEFYEKGNMFNLAGVNLATWANEVAPQGVQDFYDIEVDVCSLNLDEAIKNRQVNPDGLSINYYRIDSLLK